MAAPESYVTPSTAGSSDPIHRMLVAKKTSLSHDEATLHTAGGASHHDAIKRMVDKSFGNFSANLMHEGGAPKVGSPDGLFEEASGAEAMKRRTAKPY